MNNTTILDQKYILYLSNRLRNFRNKGNGVFEFSHSCERSDSIKRRGYFYKKGGGYNFFCHNCNESTKFFNFLKQNDSYLFEQYNTERFLNEREPVVEKAPVKKEEVEKKFEIDNLIPAKETKQGLEFLKERKIPEERQDEIFYVEDFYQWASSFYDGFKELKYKDPRIVIPYINNKDEIFGFTCRALSSKSKPKYIELKTDDSEMIYGLNHLNLAKKIYCVEGPIDSMFLDNCIAVGGASYKGEFVNKYKSNIVIVPDNDWKRNKDVCGQVLKIANEGFSVALFPDNFKFKDLNEAAMNGYSSIDLKKILEKNIKSGPELILDITFRRKC